MYCFVGKLTKGKTQEKLSKRHKSLPFFSSSDKSGQVVWHTLTLELQHHVQSHLMDPGLVNENQTALVCTLFPGACVTLTLKEFQAAP